jgi:hypothetical protein
LNKTWWSQSCSVFKWFIMWELFLDYLQSFINKDSCEQVLRPWCPILVFVAPWPSVQNGPSSWCVKLYDHEEGKGYVVTPGPDGMLLIRWRIIIGRKGCRVCESLEVRRAGVDSFVKEQFSFIPLSFQRLQVVWVWDPSLLVHSLHPSGPPVWYSLLSIITVALPLSAGNITIVSSFMSLDSAHSVRLVRQGCWYFSRQVLTHSRRRWAVFMSSQVAVRSVVETISVSGSCLFWTTKFRPSESTLFFPGHQASCNWDLLRCPYDVWVAWS